jgi:hypothetical protein
MTNLNMEMVFAPPSYLCREGRKHPHAHPLSSPGVAEGAGARCPREWYTEIHCRYNFCYKSWALLHIWHVDLSKNTSIWARVWLFSQLRYYHSLLHPEHQLAPANGIVGLWNLSLLWWERANKVFGKHFARILKGLHHALSFVYHRDCKSMSSAAHCPQHRRCRVAAAHHPSCICCVCILEFDMLFQYSEIIWMCFLLPSMTENCMLGCVLMTNLVRNLIVWLSNLQQSKNIVIGNLLILVCLVLWTQWSGKSSMTGTSRGGVLMLVSSLMLWTSGTRGLANLKVNLRLKSIKLWWCQ